MILLCDVKGEDFVFKIEGIIYWLIYFLPLCLSPLFTFSGLNDTVLSSESIRFGHDILLPWLIPLTFAELHRCPWRCPRQPPRSLGFWCKCQRASVEFSVLAADALKVGHFSRWLWCHDMATKEAEEGQRDANEQKSLSCPREAEILVPLSLLAT